MKNNVLKNGEFHIEGYFNSVEDIAKVLPFCFNSTNSDLELSFVPWSEGELSVTVRFGTGKGWDITPEELKEIPIPWGSSIF